MGSLLGLLTLFFFLVERVIETITTILYRSYHSELLESSDYVCFTVWH